MSSERSFNPSFKNKVLSSRDQAIICRHGNAGDADAPEQLQDRSHGLRFEGWGTDSGRGRWLFYFLFFFIRCQLRRFTEHLQMRPQITHDALQASPSVTPANLLIHELHFILFFRELEIIRLNIHWKQVHWCEVSYLLCLISSHPN